MLRELTVRLAISALGVPYIWAGSTLKEGFDCSGFIVWLFQIAGILKSGDWSAQQLRSNFTPLIHSDNFLVDAGSLAFYGPDQSHVTHVMLFIDHNHVIGASGGTHQTKTRADAEAIGASVQTHNVLYRTDLLGAGLVTYPDET
jgi:cell wall-associated NlpC family hydrolase